MRARNCMVVVASVVCWSLSGGVAAAPAAEKALTFEIEPAPGWVVPARESEAAGWEPSPMHYRVIDEQVRVDDRRAVNYSHVVRVVDTAAGLQPSAQIELDFDPSFQTFAWHQLDVVRAGKHLNRLDRKRIQVIQRETQLERRIIDGHATVTISLEDVRVGDEIDFAYSIRGSNPVFEGRYEAITNTGSFRGPVATHQIRLLAPSQRAIQLVGPPGTQVTTRTLGPLKETVLRSTGVTQIRPEAGAPASVLLRNMVTFTEFADWQTVARWGGQVFSRQEPSALLDAKVAEIGAAAADPEARVIAALDFVQREVRYFGTESGVYSHRPQSPEVVLTRRFGDCKDKVTLLVALLRRLDVDAAPVLVSTGFRADVDRMPTTPLAFDHVIAKVILNGATFWLDATRSRQTGPLAARSVFGYGKGLPLQAGTAGLVSLPEAFAQVRWAVEDQFGFASLAGDARLESRITYRGDLAELLRTAIDTKGLADLATELSAPYRRMYPSLKVAAPAEVQVPQDDDAVVLVQHFTIPDLWRFPEERALVADVTHWALVQTLNPPRSDSRRDPLGYTGGVYRHRIVVDFPEDVLMQPIPARHSEDGDGHFKWIQDTKQSARRIESADELRLLVNEVQPEGWTGYMAKVARVLPQLGGAISISAIPPERVAALGQRMKNPDAFLQALKPKPTTRIQGRAAIRAVVLTEQLEGGRLSPRLQAQALVARGIEYDNFGRFRSAEDDFQRALQLVPGMPEALNGAAVNAIGLHAFSKAGEFAALALERNARDAEALRSAATAKYMQGDYTGALGMLRASLGDSGNSGRGYPLLWTALTSRRSGEPGGRFEAQYAKDRWPTAWPRPILDHLVGRIPAEDVIKAAAATEDPSGSLCEAYFYLGERLAIDGDAPGAQRYWKKAVDQNVVEFLEHGLALYRLEQAH